MFTKDKLNLACNDEKNHTTKEVKSQVIGYLLPIVYTELTEVWTMFGLVSFINKALFLLEAPRLSAETVASLVYPVNDS